MATISQCSYVAIFTALKYSPVSTIRNELMVEDSGILIHVLLELWFKNALVAKSTTTSGIVSMVFLLHELDYKKTAHGVAISREEAHSRR
jgi:hypothetical protein